MRKRGILSYFMAHNAQPRGERRREALKKYRAYKSPNEMHKKAVGPTRAMRRAGKNADGTFKTPKQGKFANKRQSFARYLKGWLFNSNDLYYTHVPKQVRKGKSFEDIQKARKHQFKAERKTRANQ